jgi:hypothetical protein
MSYLRVYLKYWLSGSFCLMVVLFLLCTLPVYGKAKSRAVLPLPVASFDHPQIVSLKANPTLTGTAENLVSPLGLYIVLGGNTKKSRVVFKDRSVFVRDGQWSETVFPPIGNGVYTVFLSSGSTTLATSTLTIGLRSIPVVELDTSLPSADVTDGRLMRFKVRAGTTGSVAVEQFGFSVAATAVDVSAINLYSFKDASYSVPIDSASSSAGLLNTVNTADPVTPSFTIVPDTLVEVPPGQTYYFELDGTVTPNDSNYSVETFFVGDRSIVGLSTVDTLASTSNFIWSPMACHL